MQDHSSTGGSAGQLSIIYRTPSTIVTAADGRASWNPIRYWSSAFHVRNSGQKSCQRSAARVCRHWKGPKAAKKPSLNYRKAIPVVYFSIVNNFALKRGTPSANKEKSIVIWAKKCNPQLLLQFPMRRGGRFTPLPGSRRPANEYQG